MKETDELRRVAAKTECANGRCEKLYRGDLERIADRIDEKLRELAAQVDESERIGFDQGFASADDWLAQHEDAMAEHGWIKLPVDADGVPIHVGDEVAFLGRMTVDATDGYNVFFFAENWADGVYCMRADELRHYHAPTVEDVLREFAEKITDSQIPNVHPTYEEAIAEYAAKLRLAGDE